jgi:hypothetical protein
MPRLLPALLFALVLLAGCAPGTYGPTERAAMDRAALTLDDQLAPASRLAATAALLAEADGRFPTTPFALLGSPQAAETGARETSLSALELTPEGDALRIVYTLLPTASDPTHRTGSLLVRTADGDGQYQAEVLLTRREDPDHGGRRLDLTREESVAVRQLDGRLCLDLTEAREQIATGEVRPGRPYSVTFTPAGRATSPSHTVRVAG